MTDTSILLLAGVTGMGLGLVFFGGLWWTVRKGISSRRPALWFIGSLLLRMGVVLGGFYLVFAGHWERLPVCLLGFLVAPLLVTRMARPPVAGRARPGGEASHAA
jgi:F1F0 ATPase subunit 2